MAVHLFLLILDLLAVWHDHDGGVHDLSLHGEKATGVLLRRHLGMVDFVSPERRLRVATQKLRLYHYLVLQVRKCLY